MAKKKASGKFAVGQQVKVREGVNSPEYTDISLTGWVGVIQESSGKPPSVSYVIEWLPTTLSSMPESYLSRCEADGLYHMLACLNEEQLDAVP